ncbi:MAG: riboflavin synthase [Deltaproteobacteria bacterium]|nr:riboflavin synthase [Deltaproteobacteria bacterium]
MFTGIVEGKGEIKEIRRAEKGFILSVMAPFDLSNDKIGDSIAVNGICLTATKIKSGIFCANVSEETLSRTSLAGLAASSTVNLERALKAGDRFGGHIVTGHIDGTGRVIKKEARGESVYLEISAGEDIVRLIVEKGSVAIDGISLTVNSVQKNSFSLNIIPHTLEITTLGAIKRGDEVNIETDIIGKYVEKLTTGNKGGGIHMNLLEDCGFV